MAWRNQSVYDSNSLGHRSLLSVHVIPKFFDKDAGSKTGLSEALVDEALSDGIKCNIWLGLQYGCIAVVLQQNSSGVASPMPNSALPSLEDRTSLWN